MEKRVFNFAAGPSTLPLSVLEKAGSEITNYHGMGLSVMEMSHRSKAFQEIFNHAKNTFRSLMHVPADYEILFLQGGASTQFSMVPLNLMGKNGKAEYAVTGNFSRIAAEEAEKYGTVHRSYDGRENGYSHIPCQSELHIHPDASYFHYCANNTIFGTEWNYIPDTDGVPIVCDMSSDIASRAVDISRYTLIYAGAQKNMAPAGLTIVIIKKDAAGNELPVTPLMLSYKRMIEKDSLYNTPPCWQIYMFGLMMDWLTEQGGVEEMERRRKVRAALLYDVLDASSFYKAHADKASRSYMNVTFRTPSEELDNKFVSEAAEQDLVNLKGHRLTGGIRASIYNAMELEGVERLRDFMTAFEKENG